MNDVAIFSLSFSRPKCGKRWAPNAGWCCTRNPPYLQHKQPTCTNIKLTRPRSSAPKYVSESHRGHDILQVALRSVAFPNHTKNWLVQPMALAPLSKGWNIGCSILSPLACLLSPPARAGASGQNTTLETKLYGRW